MLSRRQRLYRSTQGLQDSNKRQNTKGLEMLPFTSKPLYYQCEKQGVTMKKITQNKKKIKVKNCPEFTIGIVQS
jgi:hypothetical protein